MKIKEATTGLYRVPLRDPHADATHGHMNQVELVIVKLFTDVGIEASGYAYTIGRGGAAIKALIDQELMPLLLNEDPRYVESLWEKMWWQLHWVGRGGVATFAISAVDMALWDAIAKAANQPLGAILGLHRDRVPVYGSGVDLNLTLDELLEEVGRFVERGFTAVKIKVGKDDQQEDIERVNAVRKLLDSMRGKGRIALMVDANMRWDVPKAITMGREFEKLGVLWLEGASHPRRCRRLCQSIRCPFYGCGGRRELAFQIRVQELHLRRRARHSPARCRHVGGRYRMAKGCGHC